MAAFIAHEFACGSIYVAEGEGGVFAARHGCRHIEKSDTKFFDYVFYVVIMYTMQFAKLKLPLSITYGLLLLDLRRLPILLLSS